MALNNAWYAISTVNIEQCNYKQCAFTVKSCKFLWMSLQKMKEV